LTPLGITAVFPGYSMSVFQNFFSNSSIELLDPTGSDRIAHPDILVAARSARTPPKNLLLSIPGT
jgi:hypothetical protein